MKPEKQIFKQGSTTYYFSSKFFPKQIRRDVFLLYSFVRVADDYVDTIPPKAADFYRLREAWDRAKANRDFSTISGTSDSIDKRIINNIVHISRKYEFDPAWVDSFLDSMQADLSDRTYRKLDDTLWYIYGSAEVIGLMMARVMGLPPEADEAARLQGRAMQYLNFIRDIVEDNGLGRCYFPESDLKKFGLKDLERVTVEKNPENFKQFIRFQLRLYRDWQQQAKEGFSYIPGRLRIPLQTAVDMYDWAADQIEGSPLSVYDHKIKPGRRRIMIRGGAQLLGVKL